MVDEGLDAADQTGIDERMLNLGGPGAKLRLGYDFGGLGCFNNIRIPITARTVKLQYRPQECAELLEKAFGWKVEPITFTQQSKSDLAYPLKAAHEDVRLRYRRDELLRSDLRGIKKETTASGNIRFAVEAADSHCDRFWAMALALHAAGTRVEVGALVG